MNFLNYITSLSVPVVGFNWVDIFIIFILFIYVFQGFFLGFFTALLDLFSFIMSFIFGLSFYGTAGKYLLKIFSIPLGFANAIGFFIVAVAFEVVFSFLLKFLLSKVKITKPDFQKNQTLNLINSILGIIPGFLSGLILVSFVLSLIISLPFSVFLKNSVLDSKIGSILVGNTQGFAKDINSVFGGAVNDTLSFLTVEPKSNEIVELNFKTTNVSDDYQAEQKMFQMVNSERVSRGIHALTFSEKLANVGRAHCRDMFARGYFSHYTPQGLSPFDRMANAGITFNYAGENLALAPNTDLAMRGLMQSPGHKANILSQNFNKIGIGVINGGIYGEMFCQEFTD